MMCKIRGLGFTEDKINDREEKITQDIKKHIYIRHSISVIHLIKILWRLDENENEHDNDDTHKQDNENNRHICQQCAKGIE
jgi:hypothetical protein